MFYIINQLYPICKTVTCETLAVLTNTKALSFQSPKYGTTYAHQSFFLQQLPSFLTEFTSSSLENISLVFKNGKTKQIHKNKQKHPLKTMQWQNL